MITKARFAVVPVLERMVVSIEKADRGMRVTVKAKVSIAVWGSQLNLNDRSTVPPGPSSDICSTYLESVCQCLLQSS